MDRDQIAWTFAAVVALWGVIAAVLLRAGRLQPGFWGQSPLGSLLTGIGLAIFAMPLTTEQGRGLSKVAGVIVFLSGVVLESRARKRQQS